VSAPALRAAIKGLDARKADEALAAAGRRLGTALAPIVSALDLREVVLSGPADLLGGALRDAASATIRKRTMPVVGNDVDLRMTALGEDVVLSGAAVLVLSGQLGVS
jgi:predicted NBD/HSP70 family sugar kinase